MSLPTLSAVPDKAPPPRLPLDVRWSVDLKGPASVSPVADGDRIFVALRSTQLTARSAADGHELWRIQKDVRVPMAADAGLVFVSAGEAVEAERALDGANAWTVPRVKTVAPLVARGGWVIAVTEAEILAIHAKDGQVVWRHPAGDVRLQPDIDGDRLYSGAVDGRVLALELATGAVVWEQYLPGGVTALAAHDGRVYAAAGDKQLYCLDGRSGKTKWPFRIGSMMLGHIAVDDDHVYVAALDNVVYALDRATGNQRWTSALRSRPIAGVVVAGHIVFVPAVAAQVVMLYDRNGRPSGAIGLPFEIPRELPPDIRENPEGVNVVAVTGGLSNEWWLTRIAPAEDRPIVPFADMPEMPGVPLLTDPVFEPLGRVLGSLVLGDPPLHPAATLGWPVVLGDPPLEPLTALPGLQLRPLSPVLPSRRGG